MNHEKREIKYLNADEDHLPFFQALANKNRLQILRILKTEDLSIRELGERLDLSSAIITKHIQALEEAGIVRSYTRPGKRGLKKLCTLALNEAQLIFNNNYAQSARSFTEVEIPISAYTDFNVEAPCGMASEEKIFGTIDDPRYFGAVNRYSISLLWFTSGYVSYPIPLMDVDQNRLEEIEITLELCSEHPGFNSGWKSDILFYLNDVPLGTWTSPGDFGDRKGKFTPSWWTLGSEYGMLKTILINEQGSFVDGTQIGRTPLSEIMKRSASEESMHFTVSVPKDSPHPGGLNLFGRHFGDYDQNILFRFYYQNLDAQEKPEPEMQTLSSVPS